MTQKILTHRLGSNILEESQLIAERKWIQDTLSLIKKQRNSLQIEKLQLESIKYNMKGEKKSDFKTNHTIDISEETYSSAVSLMQAAPKGNATDADKGVLMDEEIICNEQELDLLILSNCLYANENVQNNMEEDEDDEDVIIDMNMLMNGNN